MQGKILMKYNGIKWLFSSSVTKFETVVFGSEINEVEIILPVE